MSTYSEDAFAKFLDRPIYNILKFATHLDEAMGKTTEESNTFSENRKDTSSYCFSLVYDLVMDNESYIIYAEVPGAIKDDVKLSLLGDNKLQLTYNKKMSIGKLVHNERSSGVVKKVIQLPKDADDTKITAKCENGLMIINIPFCNTKKPTKDIPIS